MCNYSCRDFFKVKQHDFFTDAITAVLQLVVNTVILTIAAVYNSSVAVLEAVVETLTSVASAFWNPVVSTTYFSMHIIIV